MKKIICFIVLTLIMLCGAANCLASEEETYFIYKNNNFDDHEIGEKPSPFSFHELSGNPGQEELQYATSVENTKIVKLEKDGNPDNLAVRIDPDKINDAGRGIARALFMHYPMKDNGVIGFSFQVDNFDINKRIAINGNMSKYRDVNYAENTNWWNFITIVGDDVYFRDGTVVASNIKTNTWYRVDYVFDIATKKGTLYFDGVPMDAPLPNDTTNVSELTFFHPVSYKEGEYSSLFIDDLRIYVADKLVDDEVIDAQWQKYRDSSFYFGYKFESGRAELYDYMAFRKADGKRFLVSGMDKYFDGSRKVDLPTKVYEKDGKYMIPLRLVAEGFGAQVDWNDADQSITVSYKGRTMKVFPNADYYFVNGARTELDHVVEMQDNTACMELDILLHFLGKEYYLEDGIIWLDKPNEFNWQMPYIPDGVGLGHNWEPLETNIYERIMWMFLYYRPSEEEVKLAMETYSPDDLHPRIGFTKERIAEIKEGMKTDTQLKKIVDNLLVSADKALEKPLSKHLASNGTCSGFLSGLGDGVLAPLAFGYVFTEDEAKKAEYKATVWRHLEHINNAEEFPEWCIKPYALRLGEGCFGMAYAYDWIDWTDEERAFIEQMCRRNIYAEYMHVLTCPLYYGAHSLSHEEGNQSVIKGGIAVLALALYDQDPEYYLHVIRAGIRSIEGGIFSYYPNGEYNEGISYWRYAASRYPMVFKAMQTAMGTDWGILESPGVLNTMKFPFMLRGATNAFAFGDGQAESAIVSLLMFCADQTDDKTIAQFRKDQMGQSGDINDVVSWVFDTQDYKKGLDIFEEDIFVESSSTVILKTGWTRADTAVAFHGGAASDPHGHLDMGSVQFDMSGVRFGMQLPRDNYELRDAGHYDKTRVKEFWPNGYKLTGRHYYRIKGEGHNTVVANRQFTNIQDTKSGDSYDLRNGSEFIKMEFGDTSSFVWLDMTDTNKVFQSALRGVKLDKINNILEIQDDFVAKQPTDFLWSMHTYAEIEVSEDGKSAILTQNNQKIQAKIINDCDLKFEVMPAAFDETYGTAVKPPFETPNFVYGKDHPYYQVHKWACDVSQDARKLAVRTQKGEDVERFMLSVTFQPYIPGNTLAAEYTPLGKWENKDISRQNLASVTIDGEPLDIFEPEKYNYSVQVVTEKSDIPEITGVAQDPSVQIETVKATTVPGVTNLILKKDGATVGLYSFVISNINDTTKFHSDKQLPVYSYTVSSEPEPSNGAILLFDGDFGTVFATNEQGGNVIMDLGSVIEGNLKLNISCLHGYKRTENFKIEYSIDGDNFIEVFNGHNSGTTTELEQFDICNKARYVRVSFYGSSEGTYVSVTEMFVSNE